MILCNMGQIIVMNIETYAISGIVIIVPDISVTLILNQLIPIHLNIQQTVSTCILSF